MLAKRLAMIRCEARTYYCIEIPSLPKVKGEKYE
jgi:hypothetical protein